MFSWTKINFRNTSIISYSKLIRKHHNCIVSDFNSLQFFAAESEGAAEEGVGEFRRARANRERGQPRRPARSRAGAQAKYSFLFWKNFLVARAK
jgi:hypothetical protein